MTCFGALAEFSLAEDVNLQIKDQYLTLLGPTSIHSSSVTLYTLKHRTFAFLLSRQRHTHKAFTHLFQKPREKSQTSSGVALKKILECPLFESRLRAVPCACYCFYPILESIHCVVSSLHSLTSFCFPFKLANMMTLDRNQIISMKGGVMLPSGCSALQ